MSDLIVLEFNELTPALMDRFIAEGHLPAFKRLRDESVVAVTDAGEAPPHLEPWIQWVTVHTGLSFAEHRVFDLGDGPKLDAPRLWDMVSDAGYPVWVCGSMNAAVRSPATIRGSVLPDPWSPSLKPVPEARFAPFFHLIRSYVQEYTRDKPPLGRADYLRFLRFMAGHGLSARTVVDTLRQLGGERLGGGAKWKRAAILDSLLWDVFRHEHARLKPRFATFFLNSTAHFQHYYWRNLDPAAFALAPSADDQRAYADAILFGYKRMDAIVADALAMAGPDTAIVLATALSQQPLTQYDADGGRQLFRPHDVAALLRFAGIDETVGIASVMAEDFRVFFADEAGAAAGERGLAALALADGTPLLRVRRTGTEVYAGCSISAAPAPGTGVVPAGGGARAAFESLFYPITTGIKSGMHHPDGLLWMRVPGVAPQAIRRKVALTELAPTLLAIAGVPAPVRFAHPPLAEVAGAAEPLRGAA